MNAPSLGGILATRQGSLALALVCAVCAAGVLVFALGRYKTHVIQPTPQATVLYSTGEIAKGTTGTEIAAQKLYELKTEPASQVTAGTITTAAQLTNQTASADIFPGTQLTTSQFSALAAVSLALHNGTRGIEIATGGALGAVDITNPGSRVDVWAKLSGGPSYVLVASDVLVLKPATPTPVTVGNQSVPGSTLVVEVPNAEVRGVLNATSTLYLTLRPGKSGAVPVAAATTAPTATTTTTTTAGAS